jgi:hypothetical protein
MASTNLGFGFTSNVLPFGLSSSSLMHKITLPMCFPEAMNLHTQIVNSLQWFHFGVKLPERLLDLVRSEDLAHEGLDGAASHAVGEHFAQTLFLVQCALDDRVQEDSVDADVLQEAMHADAGVGSHVHLKKLSSLIKGCSSVAKFKFKIISMRLSTQDYYVGNSIR